jgi:hypothetical protein
LGHVFLHSKGLSLGASLLCLGYLLKNWRRTTSHLITAIFTLLISTYNIVIFGMRTATIIGIVNATICPLKGYSAPTFFFVSLAAALQLNNHPSVNGNVYVILSISVIPTFLWISDAFLVSIPLADHS